MDVFSWLAFFLFVLSINCQDMYPKVENFHPPKGYQPVRGYEPPNYKPNIDNHIILLAIHLVIRKRYQTL